MFGSHLAFFNTFFLRVFKLSVSFINLDMAQIPQLTYLSAVITRTMVYHKVFPAMHVSISLYDCKTGEIYG